MFILVFFSCVSIPTPILPIFVNITSLALWQRKHYRSASEANSVEMGQYWHQSELIWSHQTNNVPTFLCRILFMAFCLKWSWWHCSNLFQWIQGILKYMERSGYFQICVISPLMTSNAVSGFSVGTCRVLNIFSDIFIVYMYLSILWLYILHCTALYLCALCSRIVVC